MGCNCNKTHNISMGCCQPVLGPIENYYTKPQIDRMIDEIESAITSGCCITPEEVDEKIEEAISGITVSGVTEEQMNQAITSAMTVVEGEIPSLDGYATEQWVLDKHYITGVDLSDYVTKEEIPVVPTNVSAFNNDAGYLTEHQPIKTINGQSLIGDGDIEIGTGGTIDLSNYYTTAQTVSLVESAVTRIEDEIPSLDGYATTQWVQDQHYISGVDLSDYALKSEIPTVPTNVSAFNNDAGYLTQHQSLSAYSTTQEVINMINQSVSGKQDTLSAGTNVQINGNVISASDTKYTAGDGISISNQNVISTVTKFWCGDEAAYNQIAIKDPNTIYLVHS